MSWIAEWFGTWLSEWLGFATDDSVFPGYGDSGVATIALELDNGYTVTHRWVTDVIKSRAGNEQRIRRNDIDHESFSGVAVLLHGEAQHTRSQLAQFAASGGVFLLGLPHEALALRDDSSGTSVPVFGDALALTDWVKPGQRAVSCHLDDEGDVVAVDVVIQSKTLTAVTVDPAPDTPYGGWLMPVRHVYLEPQQNLPRYPLDVEMWNIAARSAVPLDFVPGLAQLDLGPITASAAFDDALVYAREYGLTGNLYSFGLDASGTGTGELIEADGEIQFNFEPDVTTLGDLRDALAGSIYVRLGGTYDENDTIAAGDAFSQTDLTGGTETGDVGSGGAYATYGAYPVWDRPIAISGTITDGVHAMTQILDHGGIPYALPTADRADWFRTVAINSGDQLAWQRFKRFMSAVHGRQGKFWLPTWRADLEYVSHAADELTIDADNFTMWWPSQRQHVQIEQGSTITYVEITEAVDNGDGTRTLTLSDSLSGSAVTRISWLELCRFEDADEYRTTHDQRGFSVSLTARVVP